MAKQSKKEESQSIMAILVKREKERESSAMDLHAENPQIPDQMIYLTIKLQEKILQLSKDNEELLKNNKELLEIISKHGLDEQEKYNDNLEFDKEKIKQIILDNIKIDQIFYPSDIAMKYGADLMTVVEATEELKKEKKLKDVKENADLS